MKTRLPAVKRQTQALPLWYRDSLLTMLTALGPRVSPWIIIDADTFIVLFFAHPAFQRVHLHIIIPFFEEQYGFERPEAFVHVGITVVTENVVSAD